MSTAGRAAACGLLAAGALLVFARSSSFDFANLDDPAYAGNRHVRAGLTREGLAWALTTNEQSNWHPLTWFSLMLDAHLFGTSPRAFHRTNLALHVLNTLLLFLVLERMTAAPGRSAFVAALFAVHPLHVESVVWIAERKDVLSTAFLLLALGGYVRWVKQRQIQAGMPWFVVVPFALGLMTKPMLVSLPLILLMLDFWPLGRSREGPRRLVREKAPLFALSLLSCAVTLLAQQRGGALRSFEHYPLAVRAANAAVAYVAYIGQMLFPARLAVYYPHPHGSAAWWLVAGCAVLLAATTALCLRAARRCPWLALGWLWYVVTLVPVIGIVQVGGQARADRYTYVPLIGLFLAITWGLGHLVDRMVTGARPRRVVLFVGAAIVLALLLPLSRHQVDLWRDNVTLFEHALEVTKDNALAHDCLANALFRKGRLTEAASHYREAIRLSPEYADAHGNLAATLLNQGKTDEAEMECRAALRIDPAHVRSHVNLALVLLQHGLLNEAAAHLRDALRLEPDLVDAHRYLGAVLAEQRRLHEAVDELTKAVTLDPNDSEARRLLRDLESDPDR